MSWQPKINDDEIIAKFQVLKTPSDAADLLEINHKKLNFLIFRKNRTTNYRSFTLKKRSGGTRIISAPAPALKLLQQKLNYVLSLLYKPKAAVHGFIHDKSIVTNCHLHVGKKHVFNIDLKDFFPSINFGRVRGMFMATPYNFPADVATIFAQICCHNNQLPQGAPTSPIISNMICAKLDSQLSRLARQCRCAYTRYADDITFSTQVNKFPRPLAILQQNEKGLVATAGVELKDIIHSNGFDVNESKTRMQSKTKRQDVTGLTVNRFPNVSRDYVRQIRAMLHAWAKYGLEKAQEEYQSLYYKKQTKPHQHPPRFKKVVQGKINFLRMVKGENDLIYRKFANKYCTLVSKPQKYFLNELEEVFAALWVLESSQAEKQGTGFMLDNVGLITCAHVVESDTYAFHHKNTSKKYPVTIISKNDTIDLAILRIDTEQSPHSLKRYDEGEVKLRDRITLVGFPNYQYGDSPHISDGYVSGFRMKSAIKRMRIDTPVIAGLSGGPVLKSGKVIGVAATGADRMENADDTENHGVIPIDALNHLVV